MILMSSIFAHVAAAAYILLFLNNNVFTFFLRHGLPKLQPGDMNGREILISENASPDFLLIFLSSAVKIGSERNWRDTYGRIRCKYHFHNG